MSESTGLQRKDERSVRSKIPIEGARYSHADTDRSDETSEPCGDESIFELVKRRPRDKDSRRPDESQWYQRRHTCKEKRSRGH